MTVRYFPDTGQPEAFDKERFLFDIRSTAAALAAPITPTLTQRVLDTFTENFRCGAVLWKTTDLPRDQLSYRFFSRLRTDTVAQAVDAHLLDPGDPLIPHVRTWTRLYGNTMESCDFDAGAGLAKTWIWLGGMRPVKEVFAPSPLADLTDTVTALGLHHIRFVAVDWRHHTANVYFRARGPLTRAHFGHITHLAGANKTRGDRVEEILHYLPEDYCVAVTIHLETRQVERVCFYALKIPRDRMPSLPDRIRTFFDAAPCYDADECNVVGWSFGHSGNYIKAERSYAGSMAAVLREWDCFFHGEEGRDTTLRSAS